MEYLCKSSNGHLVSLDSKSLEDDLIMETDLEDFWCGGNMCKNSPAPPHSMWSDGSPQLNTNFASGILQHVLSSRPEHWCGLVRRLEVVREVA